MAKNIGDVARDALAAGASDEEALAAVLREFPDARTKIASIKWYRSQLRRQAKRGEREVGGEGESRRRASGGTSSGKRGMTSELAARLRENATRRRDEKHAKHMKDQGDREKAKGPVPDRADMILSAARRYKREHGTWPAPSDLNI